MRQGVRFPFQDFVTVPGRSAPQPSVQFLHPNKHRSKSHQLSCLVKKWGGAVYKCSGDYRVVPSSHLFLGCREKDCGVSFRKDQLVDGGERVSAEAAGRPVRGWWGWAGLCRPVHLSSELLLHELQAGAPTRGATRRRTHLSSQNHDRAVTNEPKGLLQGLKYTVENALGRRRPGRCPSAAPSPGTMWEPALSFASIAPVSSFVK